jgi:putative SOS response-associated peptidase YedK
MRRQKASASASASLAESALLVPAPPSVTELRPVSTEVNNVRNKGAQLTEEIPADQLVGASDG